MLKNYFERICLCVILILNITNSFSQNLHLTLTNQETSVVQSTVMLIKESKTDPLYLNANSLGFNNDKIEDIVSLLSQILCNEWTFFFFTIDLILKFLK